MEQPSQALHLQRRDPSRNLARFYRLSVEPSLFADAAQADDALRRLAASKLRRGYRNAG